MRTTQAARYARWAAAAAVLLAVAVVGVYSYRYWQGREARKTAPPPVPQTVQQRSAEFSFSKVEKERTVFTVHASRATEFREGNRNLLEEVRITIFGRDGDRNDQIRTRECEYTTDTGKIRCAGDVTIDLQSAEDVRRHPAGAPQKIFHIETRKVTFERNTGIAATGEPVSFRFSGGEGHAIGASYASDDGVVRFGAPLEMRTVFVPGAKAASDEAAAATGREPLLIHGAELVYEHKKQLARLAGPVRVQQGARELTAGEMNVELDAKLVARRILAREHPELHSTEARGTVAFAADEIAAGLTPEGWFRNLTASGAAHGTISGPRGEDHLQASRIDCEFTEQRNLLKSLAATGSVVMESSASGRVRDARRLETSSLQLGFASKAESTRMERAETLAPAAFTWTRGGGAGKPPDEITTVHAERMTAGFDAEGRMENVRGASGVRVERTIPGRTPQVTTAREITVNLDTAGEWREALLRGDVQFHESDRSAQAGRARIERATDTIALEEGAVVRDALTRTTARTLVFNQRTGATSAAGEVRTTWLSAAANSGPDLAPEPAHVSSDRLEGNYYGGRAVYSGHARLWQGESVVEAESILLLRDSRRMEAHGNVAAVFPQSKVTSLTPESAPGKQPAPPARPVPTAEDTWQVRGGSLVYESAGGTVQVEQNVTAQGRQGTLSARMLEIFLTPATDTGGRKVDHAVATGGVMVRQGDRRGTSERGEYFASEQKFVLSGGHPTLYDGNRGTTTGRQLTFFFADDTILVETEEGSRTLTRHQVAK